LQEELKETQNVLEKKEIQLEEYVKQPLENRRCIHTWPKIKYNFKKA
jgi:hypothetical protein